MGYSWSIDHYIFLFSFMYRFTSRAVGAFANDPKLAVAPEPR